MIDLSGTTLNQYRLLEPLGKGGMATVYRAYQLNVGREVAVKVLSPDLADEPEFLSRFEHEARIVAGLQHPNIVAIHDFGRMGQYTYLVMRLMSGGSLDRELRAGRLSYERVIELTGDITAALDYAHGRGIVHRDLKPTNVLLDSSGHASLTDFGIAKLLTGDLITGLTAAGTVMGTPTYMAPEQWRSEAVDARTDVYALGVLVYQMLTGRVPFIAETPHGLMYQHLDAAPPPPRTFRPDLPLAVEPVLLKALSKRRADRYASAGELAHDLENALRFPAQTVYTPLSPRPPQPDFRSEEPEAYRPVTPAPRSMMPPDEAELPPLPPYQPRAVPRRDDYHDPDAVHVRHFLGTVMAVVIGVALLFGVTLGVALLLTSDQENANPEPTLPILPGATAVPSDLLPGVAIQSPDNNTSVALGETITIRFTARGRRGITRVELRRLNQTIDILPANGQNSFSGSFAYPATSTGTHILEVVPWSGEIRGTADTLTILVR